LPRLTARYFQLHLGVNRIVVQCPPMLNAASRGGFYDAALAALEQLGTDQPGGRLVVDMRLTDRVDSSGLATLVLLQVRAAERKHTVALLGVSEEIRFLLLMTRLEDRFDLNPEG
jgi:anti-anti-sigma regulatory factor